MSSNSNKLIFKYYQRGVLTVIKGDLIKIIMQSRLDVSGLSY